jgi:hypothetical protein
MGSNEEQIIWRQEMRYRDTQLGIWRQFAAIPSTFTYCRKLALYGSISAIAAFSGTAQASVSFSVDGSTTLSQASWSGSPGLALNPPNGGSSVDGNVVDSVIFQPTSAFTLGSFEFYAGNGGAGADSEGNYLLSLYDLGPSYTIPASSPYYTFTGTETDLFSAGLNVTTTGDVQFDVLAFSGVDQVSLNAGDTYDLTLQDNSSEILDIERGTASTGTTNPNFSTQGLGLSTADYASGVAVAFVPAGRRDSVGVFYAAAPVPEPASLSLMVIGAIRLLGRRRRSI